MKVTQYPDQSLYHSVLERYPVLTSVLVTLEFSNMNFRRRLISGLILGLGLLHAGHVSADETGRTGWHNNISSAWKQAKELDRPILIYVASNACVYCRKMEEGTLQDPGVRSQVRNGFVGLSINGSSQPKVARSLRVRAYPTTLVYGHDGKLITSKRGYVGPREFEQLLQSIQGE